MTLRRVVEASENKAKQTLEKLVTKLFENFDKVLATTAVLVTGVPVPLKILGTGYLVKKYYDSKYQKTVDKYQQLKNEYKRLGEYMVSQYKRQYAMG